MKINITGVVRGAAEIAVSAGVGAVVGNLVHATTPYEASKYQRILVAVGGYALGGVLGDISAKYIGGQIEDVSNKLKAAFPKQPDLEEETEAPAEEDILEIPEGETADSLKEKIVKQVKLTQKGTDKTVTVDADELKASKEKKGNPEASSE